MLIVVSPNTMVNPFFLHVIGSYCPLLQYWNVHERYVKFTYTCIIINTKYPNRYSKLSTKIYLSFSSIHLYLNNYYDMLCVFVYVIYNNKHVIYNKYFATYNKKHNIACSNRFVLHK